MTDKQLLEQALEALENLFGIPDKWTGEGGGDVAVWRLGGSYRTQQAIAAIKEALAQQAPVQEPVAFPRQAGDSTWIIDTAFIWRVKHTIDPNTPYDWTPSEEQIETVLLALEKIPSPLYTTPPQRTWVGITDEERNTITRQHAYVDNIIKATEAKLKKKNT